MYKMSKRIVSIFAIGAFAVATAACGSEEPGAEGFPTGTITMIAPYSAGGPADKTTRAIAPYLEEEFGVDVKVENIPGASGALGQQEMMQKPADGLTMQLVASTSMAVVPNAEDVGYTLDDVAFVSAVAEFPYLLASNAGAKLDTEAFFDKAETEGVRVGVPGAQSQGAIELKRLQKDHGLKITVVPFDGNADANTALLGKNIDAVFEVASDDVRGYIDSGDFAAVAIDSTGPSKYLDGVPTLDELGYDGIDLGTSYYGLGVHKDTDPQIVEKYQATVKEALDDQTVKERIGSDYVPAEFIDGDKLKDLFSEQTDAYKPYLG